MNGTILATLAGKFYSHCKEKSEWKWYGNRYPETYEMIIKGILSIEINFVDEGLTRLVQISHKNDIKCGTLFSDEIMKKDTIKGGIQDIAETVEALETKGFRINGVYLNSKCVFVRNYH